MAYYGIKDGMGIIPEGTIQIEANAFDFCSDLTSIIIPDSVTKIDEYAFIGASQSAQPHHRAARREERKEIKTMLYGTEVDGIIKEY